ncbi:putative membrane protein, partial [Mucuna pruriens]
MEPPTGFGASLWSFIRFLPFFIGLLLLGIIKVISLTDRAKQLGPLLKIVICLCVLPVLLISWPLVGIVGSIVGGAAFGYLSPIFATFEAVEEGKDDKFFHCFIDGTWSTVEKSCMVVRDVKDVCFHSYFSVMDDLRQQGPPEAKYYEIRLLHLPGAFLAAVIGNMVDVPIISFVALCKGPYMLFKGWHRLFHDLIGREGPFLETICVPFAGLAILLWPFAVAGAVLASMLASFFLGSYAGVVAYQVGLKKAQPCIAPNKEIRARAAHHAVDIAIRDRSETSWRVLAKKINEKLNPRFDGPLEVVVVKIGQESSFMLGLSYVVAALAIYDEYSNDILDMPEGTCFPRPQYRKRIDSSQRTSSHSSSISRPSSFQKAPSRTSSMKNNVAELKSFELLDALFKECGRVGEKMVSEGKDIEEAKSDKGSKVISIGLPAYCLLQGLLRSAKVNSMGDDTELTTTNRPREKFFDWFLNPLLIIKEQIKAENLSASEEDYLCKLVLLSGDGERLKKSSIGPAPESEFKRAELDAFSRRLQGIMKSMSRFPTFKRRFDDLVKSLSDDLTEKHGGPVMTRSKSAFARLVSLKSFKGTRTNGSGQGSQHVVRDVENS